MRPDRPNVILLTVDALRADRTSALGYSHPTTRRLEALAEHGVICSQTSSIAAFTQASVHSFLTSSRPLDYGGFDEGCGTRPTNLFQTFWDAGYETSLLATFPWVSRYYGYNADHEVHLFIINALLGTYIVRMSDALRAWHDDIDDVHAMLCRVGPILEEMFRGLTDFCQSRSDTSKLPGTGFQNSPFHNERYVYGKVLAIVQRHHELFGRDPRAYVEHHLSQVPRVHEWLGRNWRYCREPVKLIEEAVFRIANRVLAAASPRLAQLWRYRFKRYVDGTELADRVINEISTLSTTGRPFFLWTHFVDAHVPYCAGRGQRWYRETPQYLTMVGHPSTVDPSVAVGGKPRSAENWRAWSNLYDAAVSYVDEQIGRIVDSLDRFGCREQTLIAICGDHGEELGEHGDISHHFRLYDHNVRVPLLFHMPGMEPRRVDGLTTLLDLAPTLTALAGIGGSQAWKGTSVLDPGVAKRNHVLLETLHGGSSLLGRRPPYLAVRTPSWKYLWKEHLDPSDRFSPDGSELYAIGPDPLEQTNLYRPDHPLVPRFDRLIATRLLEIPEIARDRVIAALGESTVAQAISVDRRPTPWID